MIRPVQLLLVLLMLLPTAAFAGSQLPGPVNDAIAHWLERQWGGGQVTFEVNSRPRALDVKPGDKITVEGEDLPRGLQLVHVEIDRSGTHVQRIPVSLRVKPKAWVPVATQDLKRGEIIGEGMIRWERREVTDIRGDWPQNPAELTVGEYWMRRNVREGGILDDSMVEHRPAVIRGQQITLVAKAGNVNVESFGIALETGRTGDLIRVEHPQYRTILKGRVIEEATVLVEHRH